MADWSPLDVIGSPIYNILDTASNIPGISGTGFGGWLHTSPIWQGVRNFQSDRPGWSGENWADLAGAFVPYAGWAGALNDARLAGGALGAVNRLGVAGASAFPRSPGLAFAVGENIRYAPLVAAQTGFDLAGGNYESPIDALTSFGLGMLGATGLQMAGHALIPLVERSTPSIIGNVWRAAFEPGPELSALYGFNDNARRAASQTAAVPAVQEALSPTRLQPQLRAGAIQDLLREIDQAQELAAAGQPVPDPRLLEVDRGLLQNQYHNEERAILHEQPDPVNWAFHLPEAAPPIRNTADNLSRYGPSRNNERVRIPLTGSGTGMDNPDVLARTLGLPENWIQDVQYPGLTQTSPIGSTYLSREVGLLEGPGSRFYRRVSRTRADATTEVWSIAQEPATGMYQVVTQIPGVYKQNARARFASTRHLDPNEDGRLFFSFRTHRPERFFPELAQDLDIPDNEIAFSMRDRIRRGESTFLDKGMDFRDIYLNPETIRAAYAGRGSKEKLVRELLEGPTLGKEIASIFDTYVAPAAEQLMRSPEARGMIGMYRALFDAAEGRVLRTLYGTAAIPEDKGPITALFSAPNMADSEALATLLRQAVAEDPGTLELIRRFDKVGGIDLESIAGTPAGRWITAALKANDADLEEYNRAINALRNAGATDARTIPHRANHFGLSRQWDGSVYVPIYRSDAVEPVAIRAGHNRQQAIAKANEWIRHVEATEGTSGHRVGDAYITSGGDPPPEWMRPMILDPALLEPRQGMRGYEHEFEQYKHVDDFIAEMERNAMARARYAASVIADALTTGKQNTLRTRDPKAWEVVKTRIAQFQGQPGAMEQRLNALVDPWLAPIIGTKSVSKAADAINELNFHLLHGVGYIGTPLLNATSVLQTHLPAAMEFLSADANFLRGIGYHIPAFGADGLPTRGFHFVADPVGVLSGGFKRIMDPDEETKAIFQELWNRKAMGSSLANEFTGQDRTIALRTSEGVRDPGDIVFWARRLSSFLMSKTEQMSRVTSVGMSLEAMARYEQIKGVRFTFDQKVQNALEMVNKTNFGYFKQDRPLMFTSPLGSLFGNQKTWAVNYLFMLARYTGLASKGNFLPLLFALGTTTALGGVFAVPLIGQGIDAFAKIFEDKSGEEFIYSHLGEGGNAISFGLPSLLGMSLQGNVAAPGSNLAHDSEFFFSFVALQRAQQLGRAVGRAWDDQTILGLNPLKDEIFRRQAAQALAPRSLYRAWEAITSDELRSAATGYPMVQNLGWSARLMHGLGFRDIDVAVQYAAYENLINSRDAMRDRISVIGDAYARAMLSNDRQEQMRLLQIAAIQGVPQDRIMASARTRMRSMGLDMFGRNFTTQQLEQERSTLNAGGR